MYDLRFSVNFTSIVRLINIIVLNRYRMKKKDVSRGLRQRRDSSSGNRIRDLITDLNNEPSYRVVNLLRDSIVFEDGEHIRNWDLV